MDITRIPTPAGLGEFEIPQCSIPAENLEFDLRFFAGTHPSQSLDRRYEGNWKGGKKHGKGTYVYAGGGRYIGEVCISASSARFSRFSLV